MTRKAILTSLAFVTALTAAASLYRCAPAKSETQDTTNDSIYTDIEYANSTSATEATASSAAQNEEEAATDTTFLRKWKAGIVITDAQVRAVGLNKLFTASTIDAATKARMMNKSYRQDCKVPLSDLRILRIVHCNKDGKTQLGELVCNRIIAKKLLRIFRKLYEAHYKIERIRLIDEYDADDQRSMADNNSSCFCYREVAGTKTLSKHSLGLAVDINTLYNPYVFTRNGKNLVEPVEGKKYAFNRNQRNDIPYKIDHNDLAFKLFKAAGFTWGGNWRSCKDYQHFEYPNK